MKRTALLASLPVTGTAFARMFPQIDPMPSVDPVAPDGLNSATYPAPRTD